jgi:hypothetical protein
VFTYVYLYMLVYWQITSHPKEQKPGWLEIKFESGVGSLSVKRHVNNLKAAGLNVNKPDKTIYANGLGKCILRQKMYMYMFVFGLFINQSIGRRKERRDVDRWQLANVKDVFFEKHLTDEIKIMSGAPTKSYPYLR